MGAGYSIPTGPAQLSPLPWGNINQIQVVFSEDVNVSQSSLDLTDLAGAVATSGFTYNATTFTATWSLANPLPADTLTMVLHSTGASAVRDTTGNNALDGEWTNSTSVYPSGNGTAGGISTLLSTSCQATSTAMASLTVRTWRWRPRVSPALGPPVTLTATASSTHKISP